MVEGLRLLKRALFDTTSFDSIAASNHTCALAMTGQNRNGSFEESIRKVSSLRSVPLIIFLSSSSKPFDFKCNFFLIFSLSLLSLSKHNALDAKGANIRYKIVLSLNHVNTDLYNRRSLLEMLQQGMGLFAKEIALPNLPGRIEN